MKNLLKFLVMSVAHLLACPLGLPARLTHRAFKSEAIFDFGAKVFAMIPGLPGQYLRAAYYQQTLLICGHNLVVAFGSFFSHPTARLGNSISIGAYSIVGTADIGDGVQIASRVSILSGKHQHGRPGQDGGMSHGVSFERVSIGANTWLGEGVIVMADVGANSIVGAGGIVVKPVPDWHIAVGNPTQTRPINRNVGNQSESG